MSTVIKRDNAFFVFTKGASEIILALCNDMQTDNGDKKPLDEAAKKHINATIENFASHGSF